MKPLTHKQQAFVLAYLGEARGNGTKAAILAGYSPKTAYQSAFQNMRKSEIQAALKAASVKREVGAIASVQERDALLSEIARDREAGQTARVSAIAELNKVEGRHITRIEGELTVTTEDQVARLSDAEALALLERTVEEGRVLLEEARARRAAIAWTVAQAAPVKALPARKGAKRKRAVDK